LEAGEEVGEDGLEFREPKGAVMLCSAFTLYAEASLVYVYD
jgi:hypothetical protein